MSASIWCEGTRVLMAEMKIAWTCSKVGAQREENALFKQQHRALLYHRRTG